MPLKVLFVHSALGSFFIKGTQRGVGRSENPGMPVSFGGHNLPLLVEIELTDLPKSGGAMAPPGTTPLGSIYDSYILRLSQRIS